MADEHDLALLVERAQAGDDEAMDRLLRELRPRVLRRCSRAWHLPGVGHGDLVERGPADLPHHETSLR